MTASAANGFMNTNIADCSGTPFTFHAEYSTAKQQNQVPWAALEGGVLMQQEIGHSEVCNSVTNQDAFSASFSDGQSYSDPNVFDTCVGGSEGPGQTGEGPCDPNTGICRTRRPRDERAGGLPDQQLQPAARTASSPTATASRRAPGTARSTVSPTTESSARQPVFRQPVPER